MQPRRVREIKTHASIFKSGTHSDERHVHQFQLASLELERTRRSREKQAALRRLLEIEVRLDKIKGLIQQHQAVLGLSQDGTNRERPQAAERENPAPIKRRILHY